MAEGLVDGTAFAVDASLIAVDANKQRSSAGSDDVDWEAVARTRRSVREYLDTLDDAAWGAASETVPTFISRSDPAAQCEGGSCGFFTEQPLNEKHTKCGIGTINCG